MPLLTNTQLTVSDYYRPVFFSLVDTAVQQLKERFSDSPGLNKYRALEDVLLSGTVDENVLIGCLQRDQHRRLAFADAAF